MKIPRRTLYYELFMLFLVLLSVLTIPIHTKAVTILNTTIWVVFTVDYFARLIQAEDRKTYIKTHFFQLIAIIPLYNLFRLARLVSLFRILQLTAIGKRYLVPLYSFLRTNGFNRVINTFVILVIVIPIPLIWAEPSIKNYPDAIWFSIVTTTTVGYGDIVPVTGVGRFLAILLMLFGIGFIGALTSTIRSFITNNRKKLSSSEKITKITRSIEQAGTLSEAEINIIQTFLNSKKNEETVP
ncbi:potassium channel family protein [Paenilisteria rocourtiae]|uniref:Voltage-gated potassium channel n=1 Tax=Listeria rocourtiae TaxID=647910 RepID=A0A4R6ZRV0_9LIST|nr:potassium channel family protein [Listeria rocourtiae]MBC1434611.1 potassium channel family protein [Listeria rocourtiae]MBC1603303.1 potassium channel family protein [Listeria rocourtiae]TDR55411.1 voltage-gated potassium channel [Listeria rocourtiae]